MASGWTAAAVIVVGLVASAALFTVLNTSEETTSEALTYADGSYSFTDEIDVSDLTNFTFVTQVDDGIFTSGSVSLDSGSGSRSWSHDGVTFSVEVTDSLYFTFTLTITDFTDHHVSVQVYSDSSHNYEFDLAADGSSTTVRLLLNENVFWASLVAAITLVLFIVAALMLYAGGVRR